GVYGRYGREGEPSWDADHKDPEVTLRCGATHGRERRLDGWGYLHIHYGNVPLDAKMSEGLMRAIGLGDRVRIGLDGDALDTFSLSRPSPALTYCQVIAEAGSPVDGDDRSRGALEMEVIDIPHEDGWPNAAPDPDGPQPPLPKRR